MPVIKEGKVLYKKWRGKQNEKDNNTLTIFKFFLFIIYTYLYYS